MLRIGQSLFACARVAGFMSTPSRLAYSRTVGIQRGAEPGVASCEPSEGRPVEVGPAACHQRDETVVHEARNRHGHRLMFGFRQGEPENP